MEKSSGVSFSCCCRCYAVEALLLGYLRAQTDGSARLRTASTPGVQGVSGVAMGQPDKKQFSGLGQYSMNSGSHEFALFDRWRLTVAANRQR